MATYLDPKPAFLVHYEVMLTPKVITNPAYIRVGGRVLADFARRSIVITRIAPT